MRWRNGICKLNLWRRVAPNSHAGCPAPERLTQAFLRLQDIDLVRTNLNDPQYCRSIEQRIIWRELLDLELQHLDEQIGDLSQTADTHIAASRRRCKS